jgi:hypothetical protein
MTMSHPARHRPHIRVEPPLGQAGFSLAELVVGIALTVLVLLIALLMFDVNARVSRVQTSVTDMQQAQRIGQNELVRLTRMAGRGGLPIVWALDVRDNVNLGLDEDEDPIVIGDNDVIDGSDILTVRGVFSTPIYQVNSRDEASYDFDTGDSEGTLTISSSSPTGVFQDLTSLSEAEAGEALIVVSPVDDGIYAVVELTDVDFTAGDTDGDGTEEDGEGTISVVFAGDPAASDNNALFMAMSANGGASFATELQQSIAFVGLLEEYRFYVRDDASAAGGYAPSLARARFYPNTEEVHPSGTDGDDIADNILDLQIARAYDLDNDGTIDENADDSADEWLLNHADDDPEDAAWVGKDLLNVRLSTLARTDRPDRGYVSPVLADLENRDYGESPVPATVDDVMDRGSRRRRFVTVVDLRNFT